MSKIIAVAASVWPYTFLLGCAGMSLLPLNGSLADVVLLAFFGLYILLGIVIAALYGIFGRTRHNFPVKLAHLPADLAAAAFVAVRAIENAQAAAGGAMGVGLSIFVLLLFGICYSLPRLAMLIAGAIVCDRAPNSRSIHTVLHFFPLLDLLCAARLHKFIQN